MSELRPAPGVSAPYADLIGRPFQYGASGPHAYDCFGIFKEMCDRSGLNVPDYARPDRLALAEALIADELKGAHGKWVPCERGTGAGVLLRAGRYVGHIGFMLSDNEMIHCWEPTGGVTVEYMSDWERRVTGYYRFEK